MRLRLYYFPFWIAAVLSMFLFSSCGTMKKVTDKKKTQEHVVTESVTKETAASSSSAAISRTITEEITLPFVQKKDSATATGTQLDLDEGKPICFEDDDFVIETKKDTSTGRITSKVISKEKTHQLPGKRRTEELINSVFNGTVSADSYTKQDVETHTEEKVTQKEHTSGINWTLIIAVIISLLLIILLAFFIWRRRKVSE